MPNIKDEMRQCIDSLPDDASWEDLQYAIYLRERIERGRREVEEGKLISQDEVEARMERWLTK